MNNLSKIRLLPARCALDLGDGSERGEYVKQGYILNSLGRLHRGINLMYCYYPYDRGWPERASIAHARDDVSFAWDYPYDDYFPYQGGISGRAVHFTDEIRMWQQGITPSYQPFEQMQEIRRFGQDVILTLTIDPNVDDYHLRQIALELSCFGRLMLRINHEATGNWFAFNKRCTYQEVADFFVHFHHIIKERAPHIKTILCIDGLENIEATRIDREDEFAEAVRVADIWSIDKYLALHWGWPYSIAEPGGTSHKRSAVADIYELTKKSYQRFVEINNGVAKPMLMSEFNADGDVTGAYEQAEMVREFLTLRMEDPDDWLNGITFYQFRDRGRLGLEIEDPSDPDLGIAQPVMNIYKEFLRNPYFSPSFADEGATLLPAKLRWGGSEDAEGVAINVLFAEDPVFCEITFEEELNLIIELNGRWFYKAPTAKTIDLMPAFYDNRLPQGGELSIRIFAPPADGMNPFEKKYRDEAFPANADWLVNTYTLLTKMPTLRLRYRPASE